MASHACSVATFRGRKYCQLWRVWSGLGVIESAGIRAVKLSQWGSCSVHNYRFVLTDLLCRFLWAGILSGKFTIKSPWDKGRQFFISGAVFQKRSHRKPISVLIATPNFQLLPKSRTENYPHISLWNSVEKHWSLYTVHKSQITSGMFPGTLGIQIGIKETAPHLYPLCSICWLICRLLSLPGTIWSKVLGSSLFVNAFICFLSGTFCCQTQNASNILGKRRPHSSVKAILSW